MKLVVRLLTIVVKNSKCFVTVEIPNADITGMPVFHNGKGQVEGSFTRVGDSVMNL